MTCDGCAMNGACGPMVIHNYGDHKEIHWNKSCPHDELYMHCSSDVIVVVEDAICEVLLSLFIIQDF